MTDKELIELAAKAAGLHVKVSSNSGIGLKVHGNCNWWNPLTDDGDALRLAVSLGFIVDIDTEEHYTEIEFTSNYEDKSVSEGHGFDATEATRRAITRAAAQIGKEIE